MSVTQYKLKNLLDKHSDVPVVVEKPVKAKKKVEKKSKKK